jgi:RES domain-containing protein
VTLPPDEPLPPADLARRDLPIVRLAGPWLRIHRQIHDPIFFGTTGLNRFDDPRRRYGVLYAAEALDGAFIETFGRSPGVNTVSQRQLDERAVALIDPARSLRLVDLTGPGLAHIGATGSLTSGSHAIAQLWSRALWAHASRPDGLLFRARHDPSCLSVAIFSRAARVIRATPVGGLMDRPRLPLLAATLRRCRFSVRP